MRDVRRYAQKVASNPTGAGRAAWYSLRRRTWVLPPNHRVSPGFVAPPRGPAQHAFSRLLKAEHHRGSAATVVILTEPSVRAAVPAWIAHFAKAKVFVIAPATLPEWHLAELGARHLLDQDMSKINWRMKALGAVDVVVDLMPHSVSDQRAQFSRLFWHLKPQGVYVVDPAATGTDPFATETASWVADLLRAEEQAERSHRDRELTRAISRVDVSRDLISIEKRAKHYLKLRDSEANRILPQREPSIDMRVLARLSGGTLTSRAQVTSHESSVPILGLDETMDYPALSLRHYRGDIAMVSNQLLYAGYTILPDSFRHHLEQNPKNPRIASSTTEFARISEHLRPNQVLRGDFYHVDSENSGHFGHLTTEVLSRLWGWRLAKREIPDLKLIFRIRFPNERNPAMELRYFTALGIKEDDIVWTDQSVRLRSLVAATPMWHNQVPHYVHPEIKPQVWDRLGDALIDPDSPSYDKIFVSRPGQMSSRNCRNAVEVEALFAAHGFEIVYPELLDVGTQAGIFSKARVIAGFGGSAMFNVLFARNLETFIVLSHEAYTARNEHLFTSMIGCEAHYFWSRPDVPQPPGGWTWKAYKSDWSFDFAQNGEELTKLLTSL